MTVKFKTICHCRLMLLLRKWHGRTVQVFLHYCTTISYVRVIFVLTLVLGCVNLVEKLAKLWLSLRVVYLGFLPLAALDKFCFVDRGSVQRVFCRVHKDLMIHRDWLMSNRWICCGDIQWGWSGASYFEASNNGFMRHHLKCRLLRLALACSKVDVAHFKFALRTRS